MQLCYGILWYFNIFHVSVDIFAYLRRNLSQEEETKDIWGIMHGAASLFATFVNHEFGGRLVADGRCLWHQQKFT